MWSFNCLSIICKLANLLLSPELNQLAILLLTEFLHPCINQLFQCCFDDTHAFFYHHRNSVAPQKELSDNHRVKLKYQLSCGSTVWHMILVLTRSYLPLRCNVSFRWDAAEAGWFSLPGGKYNARAGWIYWSPWHGNKGQCIHQSSWYSW